MSDLLRHRMSDVCSLQAAARWDTLKEKAPGGSRSGHGQYRRGRRGTGRGRSGPGAGSGSGKAGTYHKSQRFGTYKVGDTAKALTVEATTTDGGTITYQWVSVQHQ